MQTTSLHELPPCFQPVLCIVKKALGAQCQSAFHTRLAVQI